MSQSEITISVDGGSFHAYVARPELESAPGLLIAQEIFGVNAVMRELADTYAKAGYLAVVPDLFWRQSPGIQLTDQTESDWAEAFKLFQGFDQDKGIDDLIATLQALKNLPGCSGKVGSVGYCLGGKLAYLMATRSNTECNVGYYGVGIEQALDEADQIQHPFLLHFAEQDKFGTSEARLEIQAQFSNTPNVTIYVYPAVDHAFARPGGQTYDEAAATLANQRTLDFLKANLG
jgi:carboxymethylenebutenolidase